MTQKISDERLWSWVDRDAPELAEHLEGHPEDQARVHEIRAAMRGVAAATGRLPDRIGPYRIRRLLGEGGMGLVYEAEQSDPRRSVALKVIRPGAGDSQRLAQLFRREVTALARLSHPDIATIYEAGQAETGEPYFAMELVEGRPLDRWLREEKPFRGARIELMRRIAEAVEHAHRHGVIHRDLKPSNILIDAEGRPKILDFGLARVTDDEHERSLVTRTGSLLGTLPYMSPEQVRGQLDRVDHRADVYALGVILYQMLCDRLPYELPTTSLPEAARIICDVAPRRLRRVDRYLRGDLETITLKALAKSPRARYASAGELAEDIRRFQSGEPIHALPPTIRYRMLRFSLRHKLLVSSATVIAFLLAWIAIAPPIDYYSRVGGDSPKISPFEDVRWKRGTDWRGTIPLVKVQGRWYELLAIDDLNAQLIVEYCKQTNNTGFMKRFSEDLVGVLHRLGNRSLLSVDLTLRDPETGLTFELPNTPMTGENRRSTYHRRYVAPWEEAEWDEGRLRIRLGERWFEVLTLAGRDVDEWREAVLGPRSVTSFSSFGHQFMEAATYLLGETPLDSITARLRDEETDEVKFVSELPVDNASLELEHSAPLRAALELLEQND